MGITQIKRISLEPHWPIIYCLSNNRINGKLQADSSTINSLSWQDPNKGVIVKLLTMSLNVKEAHCISVSLSFNPFIIYQWNHSFGIHFKRNCWYDSYIFLSFKTFVKRWAPKNVTYIDLNYHWFLIKLNLYFILRWCLFALLALEQSNCNICLFKPYITYLSSHMKNEITPLKWFNVIIIVSLLCG